MKTNTTTAEKLLDAARQQKLSLPEVMLRREQEQNETPPETVYEKLGAAYAIMRQAVENSLKEPHRTMGGAARPGPESAAEPSRRARSRPRACPGARS